MKLHVFVPALFFVGTTAAMITAQAAADHVSTKETRSGGQATYGSAGCVQCHGADWSGTDKGPDLRAVGKEHSRDDIRRQIAQGGGGMPPFAEALTEDQITGLVDFLEAQKGPPKPSGRRRKHTSPKPAAGL